MIKGGLTKRQTSFGHPPANCQRGTPPRSQPPIDYSTIQNTCWLKEQETFHITPYFQLLDLACSWNLRNVFLYQKKSACDSWEDLTTQNPYQSIYWIYIVISSRPQTTETHHDWPKSISKQNQNGNILQIVFEADVTRDLRHRIPHKALVLKKRNQTLC